MEGAVSLGLTEGVVQGTREALYNELSFMEVYMLEAIIFGLIIQGIMFLRLSRKSYHEFDEKQKRRLDALYAANRRKQERKGLAPLSEDQFRLVLKKSGAIYLIISGCLIPIYIFIFIKFVSVYVA